MIIATYEDTLAAIGKKASEIEFAEVEIITQKPVMNLNYPKDSFAESKILNRQAYIHFE